MACTATCGSSAHAWMQRSPPLRSGCSASPRNARQRLEGRRTARREAEPVGAVEASVNRPGPKPNVIVRPLAGRPERLAGVDRRSVVGAADGAALARPRGPAVRRAAASVHSVSSSTSPARSRVSLTSNAAKCRRSCAGVDDARLVRAEERVGGCRGTRARAAGSAGRGDGDARSARRADRGARRSGPEEAEEAAAADAVGGSLVGHQASGSVDAEHGER